MSENAVIRFMYDFGNENLYTEKHKLIHPLPDVTITANSSVGVTVNITALNAGHLTLGVNSSSSELEKYNWSFFTIMIIS